MIYSNARIVFVGDSVTDCGRRVDGAPPLGEGYVSLVAKELLSSTGNVAVLNAGINGNRSQDLVNRWESDVLGVKPTVISIMVGINDTWRRFDRNDPTTPDDFEMNYRSMLQRSVVAESIKIVLVEPFLLPVLPGQHDWLKDLEEKIEVVQRLAGEFGTELLRAHEFMNEEARIHGAESLAPDGVHPSALGHQILAEQWLAMMV